MKKIFLLIASVCALASCDPAQEDITNGGHITVEQLMAQTKVSLDVVDGKNGNVVTCETSAPVIASWDIKGKKYNGNYATKKMSAVDVGQERTVILNAICADGTKLTCNFPIKVDTLSNPLKKIHVYEGPDVVLSQGDAAAGRFSDNEGKGLPYIKEDVYFGLKTLIFNIKSVTSSEVGMWGEPAGGPLLRIMTGWWSPVFADDVEIKGPGLWELELTEDIAKACSKGKGDARDLDILLRRGSITISEVYYEE